MTTTRFRPLALLLALALLFTMSAPATADGTLIIGEVTITNNNRVNIRRGGSTGYPIIGSANPGDLYQTTGRASTGWYEILLDDGTFGFVSDTLVFFVPYSTPIPIGGQYSLPVYYRTAQGASLRSVTVPVRVGQNTVTADDSQVPGYRLISARSVLVNVDAQGRANPAGVVFTYEPTTVFPTAQPATAIVPIYYRDAFNNIVASETRTLAPGAHLVRADITRIPSTYILTGTSDAVVIVSYTGTASPASVNFIVTPAPQVTPPPVTARINVSYRDQAGSVLYTEQVTALPGYTTITANDARVPAGMTLVSSRNVTVFVSSTGASYPSGVIFTYANPTRATIQIIYMDTFGRYPYAESRVLAPGTHAITADDSRVASNYVLQGSRTRQVTVSQSGVASPTQVVFTYGVPAVNATISVRYQDTAGRTLYTESRTLTPGTHTITANDARVPAGYVLQGQRNQQVTAYSNGTASSSQVVFTYAQPPQNASVNVVYRDQNGTALYSENLTLSQGTHTITANDARVPAGYTLTSQRNVQVSVSNGVANPSQVSFWYNRAPQNANVNVVYYDQNGSSLYTETRTLGQGTHTITANDARVPAGYTLTSQRNVQVTVNNGIASPSQVSFWYTRPVSATVNILYRDENGSNLYTETRTLPQGTHTVTANDNRVPNGYSLTSQRNVQVTVSSNGNVSPNPVTFTYAPPAPPVTVNVPVIYQDENGSILYQTQASVASNAPTSVTAFDNNVPSGYTLISDRRVPLSVNSQGVSNPTRVMFTYRAPAGPPITVNIPVIYQDENGSILYQTQVRLNSGESTSVTAFDNNVPNGYTLISDRRVAVSVNSQGNANPRQVTFTYRAPGQPSGDNFILPPHQEFSYRGDNIPVYSGPYNNYWRANGGRASLGGGRVRVWGIEGEYAMIGYGLSNNLYRIGWIHKDNIPSNLNVPELEFSYKPATITSNAQVTDDPIIDPQWLFEIPRGTKVTFLAYEDFVDHWAYIETEYNGKPVRGFINKSRLRID